MTTPSAVFADPSAIRFALPAPPLELVDSKAKFRTFAADVAAEVERLLGIPAAVDDTAILRLLLNLRGHLAHEFGDNEKAVSTAAWIRSLQAKPSERAFAGLTTLATVAARRAHPGAAPSAPNYRATFLREFAQYLAALPATGAIVAVLQAQRSKIAALSTEALLAETRDLIAPDIARRGCCGLEEADRLVRVEHRLQRVLPVRAEMLAALETALAERTAPLGDDQTAGSEPRV